MTDQELKDLVASLAIDSKEMHAAHKEMYASQKETSEQMKLTDAQIKRTDEQIMLTDAQMKSTFEQMKRNDKVLTEKLDRMGITLGNMGQNQGAVAEEFFYNSLKETQTLAGVHYDFIDKNILRSGNGVSDEFDMILVNGKDVAIVEVKYKAHATDLDKLLSKKYANFKKLFPAYKNYRHHLVLATFHLYDELKQQALDHNVIVLQRKGNLVESYLPKSEVH